ncbi:uncharacterized protein ACLA_099060 [Aspergillus clavatus NRRL 1]|uniref:GPI anchored protein n=1 Tax=Aspergillus clavatus (strain ATCC 1007 / CBS 513.65 / DSM 816 / NCTC 3887 / NRRL 1 / QM 1276 / 107) TaxID=344612 RepID=A1CN25_ASPCL|nr:GPI anchored hypothetical protein [Aspergillus clavatus NRRL 1]EAW08962.1 GPI anchored hypothetical protein [Aspergillus clavatus NRRL 1]
MQFKTLAPLVLASLALASPAPQNTGTADSSGLDTSDLLSLYDSAPSSILNVLATAVPSTWIAAMANPTSVSSIVNDIEHGTYPAWYSSLPESVKAWATSAALGDLGVEATATPSAGSDSSSSDASTKGTTAGPAETASGSSTATHSDAHTTDTPASKTGSSSGSSSSAATSPTSSPNAAPAATGAVAMSLAGVAGLLGVAFVL